MSQSYRAKLSPLRALPFDAVEVHAVTTDPEETRLLAAAISDLSVSGDLILLTGEMGAGKTCFTQGLARGLGIDERVTSPTFTLANTYDGRLVLNHLDVYRLDDPAETLDLDLPDMLESGVTIIEWGNQIDAVLPRTRLEIEIRWPDDGDENKRIFLVRPFGHQWLDRADQIGSALARWTVPC